LKNPLLSSVEVLEPWARQALAAAGQNGQTIILSMDQTDVGDRFALLMVSLSYSQIWCMADLDQAAIFCCSSPDSAGESTTAMPS